MILRDINRTFPAHDYFKEAGGVGQDSLYKISKAYAVYDEEVGYCQGLSFLAAALLLHVSLHQIIIDTGILDSLEDSLWLISLYVCVHIPHAVVDTAMFPWITDIISPNYVLRPYI